MHQLGQELQLRRGFTPRLTIDRDLESSRRNGLMMPASGTVPGFDRGGKIPVRTVAFEGRRARFPAGVLGGGCRRRLILEGVAVVVGEHEVAGGVFVYDHGHFRV
jgi:hypothetical protein